MLINISPQRLSAVKNPALKSYAQIYLKIEEQFRAWVKQTGLSLAQDLTLETETLLTRLRTKGAQFRNDDKSVYVNRISPACLACQQGVGSVTLFISLMCHRRCFFCFNENQDNYGHFSRHKRTCLPELNSLSRQAGKLVHLALTGGEPLLHKPETFDFFRQARLKFPAVYTRLYTSGDLLETKDLQTLRDTRLDEIRFSIKIDDPPELKGRVLENIALAKAYIPTVVVEMPVIPGSLAEMQDLLVTLDSLGIFGINLLEFCFPLHNAGVFRQKGLQVKNPPYRVLYDYWYAGGLPISQSESDCLNLLEFALDRQLDLGVHYCSLENKHTAQIYQQNYGQRVSKTQYFSPKDYFFKSAKVFGADITKVLAVFKQQGYTNYQLNADYQYLEFHVEQLKTLLNLDIEVGISYNILENRGDGSYLRELKLDLTSPKEFDLAADQ